MRRTSLPAAALAGFAGGLAGAWAMDQFTRVWNHLVPRPKQGYRPPLPYSAQEWDSTSRTVSCVTHWITGRHLSPRGRRFGAQAVHFCVGGLGGVVYAALNCRSKGPMASGLVFGTALWLLGEEIAMSVLGINDPPGCYSLAEHANSLGEHFVYGIATGAVARALLKHF